MNKISKLQNKGKSLSLAFTELFRWNPKYRMQETIESYCQLRTLMMNVGGKSKLDNEGTSDNLKFRKQEAIQILLPITLTRRGNI